MNTIALSIVCTQRRSRLTRLQHRGYSSLSHIFFQLTGIRVSRHHTLHVDSAVKHTVRQSGTRTEEAQAVHLRYFDATLFDITPSCSGFFCTDHALRCYNAVVLVAWSALLLITQLSLPVQSDLPPKEVVIALR